MVGYSLPYYFASSADFPWVYRSDLPFVRECNQLSDRTLKACDNSNEYYFCNVVKLRGSFCYARVQLLIGNS